VLKLNDITLNIRLGNLIGRCFEMPYVSYCQPLVQFYKTHNMKHLDKLLVLIFTFFIIETFSQNNNENKSNDIDTSFVLHSSTYPMYARELGIQGTVYVTFDIDSTCTISNIKIIKSLCANYCDKALISDIKNEEIYLKKENKSKCIARKVLFTARYRLRN